MIRTFGLDRTATGDPTGRRVTLALRAALIALAVAAAATCDSGDAAEEATVRDSAGITIVENRSREPDRRGWTLSSEPALVIGAAMEDAAYAFSNIAGVVRREDGGFVVADGASNEVRYFDRAGHFERATGTRGDGPGEFRLMASIGGSVDGGVWVYDFSLRRITLLDPDGGLDAVVTLEPGLNRLNMLGRSPDGGFVLAQSWSPERLDAANGEGLRRDSVVYARFAPDGSLVDTLGLSLGREIALAAEPSSGRMTMGTPPFARSTDRVMTEEHLYIGEEESYEIQQYDLSGRLHRLIRMPAADLQITDAMVRDYKEAQILDTPQEERTGMREYLDAIPVAPGLPAHGYMRVDAESNLWVSSYPAFVGDPRFFDVFDPEGRWITRVDVPDGFDPLVIGADWVLGVGRDELGVEMVQLYGLNRSGGA